MLAKSIPETIQDIIAHKACGPLIRHWLNLSTDGSPPKRQQLDPVEFWYALPDLSIHIYDEDLKDYHMELAGDHILELDLKHKTGSTLRESYGNHNSEIAETIIENWDKVRQTQQCLIAFRNIQQEGQQKSSMRCVLPLREPEAILCYTIYEYDAPHAHDTLVRDMSEYQHFSYTINDLIKLIG